MRNCWGSGDFIMNCIRVSSGRGWVNSYLDWMVGRTLIGNTNSSPKGRGNATEN